MKNIIERIKKEPLECHWSKCGGSLGLKFYECCDGRSSLRKGFKYCPYCGRKIKVVIGELNEH